MKLQVLPLPPEQVGEMSMTPYVLIFSEASLKMFSDDIADEMKNTTGARAILVFDGDVEVVR